MMKAFQPNKEDGEVRRGPWTLEEDNLLIQYIARHGEGRWNALAKSAGLKRTGKSCRLRWLNYLKPDIKRGNLTPQEQLTILELHSKWGNRWSKIAQHLPGRTDNEIKNYWRTRVQKQAKQLNMESNSQGFIDAIKCFYMPRLIQKIEQNSISSTLMDNYHQASSSSTSPLETTTTSIDQSYMDYSRSSASAPSFYSSESAKVMNPIEIATYPSYQSDGYNNYQGGSQSKDNSVLSSSKWYYVENCNNEMQEVPAISAAGQCSDVHLANHDWINSDMGGDMWNLDGVWPW